MLALVPQNEAARLKSLHSYRVLDTGPEESFDNIVELAAMMTSSPLALVSLVDEDRQWFKARIGADFEQMPRDISFCSHAILHPCEPLIVEDALQDERFADNPLVTGEPGIRFYAGFALLDSDGAALGTLCIVDYVPRRLDEASCRILARLAALVTRTLEMRRALLRAKDVATLDSLTGLLSRPAMMDAIATAIARLKGQKQKFSLLYADLDGFKQINDRQGHAAGDAALCQAAAALRHVTRQEDAVARLGGDEFALLVVGDDRVAANIAKRFMTELRARMTAGAWAITASVGWAFFPSPPDSAEIALAVADRLMYLAKAAGKDRLVGMDGERNELWLTIDHAAAAGSG